MKKHGGRKKPKKQKASSPASAAAVRAAEPIVPIAVKGKTHWWPAGRTLSGLFVLVGFIAALGAIWDFYWVTRPEIRALGADASGPFTLPFAVKNPGHIFSMRKVTFYCGIVRVDLANGAHWADFAIAAENDHNKDIEPGDQRNYRCRLSVSAPGVKSAKIGLYAFYRTLWFDRRSTNFMFTWSPDSVPPRWIEGD